MFSFSGFGLSEILRAAKFREKKKRLAGVRRFQELLGNSNQLSRM
jgi:hypothetical protein